MEKEYLRAYGNRTREPKVQSTKGNKRRARETSPAWHRKSFASSHMSRDQDGDPHRRGCRKGRGAPDKDHAAVVQWTNTERSLPEQGTAPDACAKARPPYCTNTRLQWTSEVFPAHHVQPHTHRALGESAGEQPSNAICGSWIVADGDPDGGTDRCTGSRAHRIPFAWRWQCCRRRRVTGRERRHHREFVLITSRDQGEFGWVSKPAWRSRPQW